MNCRLMEDHRDAYFLWKELGLKNHVCVHVDAHLDVSNLKAPGYEVGCRPEINCGNFLRPALQEDILSALIWVIPRHLPGQEALLDWTCLELQNWMRLDLSDYMSLQMVEERVEGTLLGKPFTVCYAEHVPPLQEPHLLDIDIDYYLGPEDELWQTPAELTQHLALLQPRVTTIAYSVQGGYTPLKYRHLAPSTARALGKGGPYSEAEPESPGDFSLQPIDQVSAALMRESYEEAEEHLQRVENPREAEFMRGMIALKRKDFEGATACWESLMAQHQLDGPTTLYLLTTCARVYLEWGRPQRAYETLNTIHARNDSEVIALMARACARLERYEEAARLFRKAVKLDPDLLETAEIELELAEIYLKRGQVSLAQRLIRQTLQSGRPGFMKVKAEALQLKLALGSSV